ncbi:MAG: hypothetical protein IPP19_08305 [Verrucomicrobia bacterium]|nr:hypothetical protein [Verrucomicrobiota bacterium]
MSFFRQKWFIRLALAVLAIAGLSWLSQLDYNQKISSNILDLVPSDERAPELALTRELASEVQSRVALFALDLPAGSDRRAAATEAFMRSLRDAPAFAEAVSLQDTAARDTLGRQVFQQRFDLLLPGWLESNWLEYAAGDKSQSWEEWLAERTVIRLQNFLSTPEALGFQDILPADPLLLLPGLVGSVQGLDNPASTDGAGPVLVWARTSGSPWKEEGQQPVFAAVKQAQAAAQIEAPGMKLRWVSIGRFAGENRARIEQELSGLNLLSLAAVMGIAALCLKRVFKALHLAPVMLGGLLGAWVATTLVFDRVHVLVFVVGSLLGGVAVDYGFYLYLQPPAFPDEPYRSKVRRLIKPLLSSALTTVIGFSLLLFSELPLIRQLGVFVSAGLLSALATALLWFAQIKTPFMQTRGFASVRFSGDRPRVRLVARGLIVVGVLVAVGGPWLLKWRDNIRELEIPTPELQAEATEVRALFGDSSDRTLYITRGRDLAEARAALARFSTWHAKEHPGVTLASIGNAVPTASEWQMLPERIGGMEKFVPALQAALERHGFDAAAFGPFFNDWQVWRSAPRSSYDEVGARLVGALHGPMQMMASIGPDRCWFFSVANHSSVGEPPADTGTVGVSGLENMNQLFGRYRVSALRLSAWGLGLVGLSMLVLYGPWRGAKIFSLPLGSCLFAFGLLGVMGQTLNLFHLLGAFLGVCLSHNYAIFTAENAARGEEQPPSIRLSALTTAASFGMLALSEIPVVKALGTTVALIVVTALVAVELVPLARRPLLSK